MMFSAFAIAEHVPGRGSERGRNLASLGALVSGRRLVVNGHAQRPCRFRSKERGGGRGSTLAGIILSFALAFLAAFLLNHAQNAG